MYIFGNIAIIFIAFVSITILNEVTPQSSTTQEPFHTDNDNDAVHNYNTYFTAKDHLPWELTREVLQKSRINTIISTFAVKFLLGILVEATAGGSTAVADEVKNVIIGAEAGGALSFREYGSITKALQENNNENYTLITKANLFTTDGVQANENYTNILKNEYDNTVIDHLDFEYPARAAETINEWSNGICLGQMLNSKDVESSMLLLANINYFKGHWLKEFELNSKGTFFRTPTQQIGVRYMESTDTFYYMDSYSLDVKMLRLPFMDPNISMFIVLPNTKSGLNILIQDLGNEQIKRMQWLMEPEIVHATIPKFKFKFSYNLRKVLQKLNVNNLFHENATLAQFTVNAADEGDGNSVLKVSDIFQKTCIEISETGNEVTEHPKYNPSRVKQFLVNRPFMFFIEDNRTKNILFTGQVLDPTIN